MIRLQEKTPDVYCSQSRDFQLLCRLYDCVINGVKLNVDGVSKITDTSKCRTNLLPLLERKLGFFTKQTFNDETIRYILSAFPIMVKNKGSLKAVKQAINTFLKVKNVNSDVTIWYIDKAETEYRTGVANQTLVIGLSTNMRDVTVLEELFKYILPAGFTYSFYFYETLEERNTFTYQHNAKVLYVSDNINSALRSNSDNRTGVENRLLNAVNTIELIADDTDYTEGYPINDQLEVREYPKDNN